MSSPQSGKGFYEVWYLKLNDPVANRALWLRFTLLSTRNGFRRVAEVWALHFQREHGGDVTKTALKQVHDISGFAQSSLHIQIGDCELGEEYTHGSVQGKGHSIRWDLKIRHADRASFNFVPDALARAHLVQNFAETTFEDLRFTGTVEVDGQKQEWTEALGMWGHLKGARQPESWVWGHCNSFVDESGRGTPFIFDGVTARVPVLGRILAPKVSSFYFHYQGKDYRFNSVRDILRLKSNHSLTSWTFQADQEELSFRGEARSDYKDFAGLTYEDTNGSLLYCANSKLSDMKVHVYRRGKLETTLAARGTAAFEVVSRKKNPYVPLLL